MKQLVLSTLGLLGVAGVARGQALDGYFASTTKGWVADLLFFEGNHFSYVQTNCTSLVKGKGIFTVQRNVLTLRFESPDGQPPTLFCADNTSAKGVSIQVYDQTTDQPLLGVTAITTDRKHGATTSGNGQAWFDYTPSEHDMLKVFVVGYATQYIPLRAAAANCFKVLLSQTTYLRAGTTYTFPLKAVHPHAFTSYLHYKRVSAARARKILAKWERQVEQR